MTTSTPNLGLVLYNSTTDSAEYFSNFRAVIAGTSLSSNFYKIDTAYGSMQTEIDTIQAGAYFTLASYISANYYESTVTGITSYVTGMKIILSLDTASAGTVTLNINSLGIKSVMKIDISGTPVNISDGELMVGKYYFFAYDGTRWVWVDSTSADQIYVSGNSGNILTVGADNTISGSSTQADILNGGWTEVSDTWTYASANTINIPTDGTTVYQKSDKFRFKQGAGYKYFYCTVVTATLITLTGGTDFTVANAAITDIAYSRSEKPFGFSNWLNCAAPVYDTTTIDNGTGGNQPATTETLFRIDGDSVKVKSRLATTNVVKNTAGQTIAFNVPLTLPSIADATFEVIGTASIGGLNYAAAPQVKTTGSVNIVSSTSIADNASIVASSFFMEYRF